VAPAGHLLGYRVQEGDGTARIGGDDRIADAAQRGGEPALRLAQAPLQGGLDQGDFEHRPQFLAPVGLGEEAIGSRLGGFGAVHGAAQDDIHEHRVGAVLAGQFDRFDTRGGGTTTR